MALTKVTNRIIDGAFSNALDYGAVDDGSTDNTASISTAITSLSNGSVLYIPPKCVYNYESLSSAAKTKIENSDIGLMDHSRSLFGGRAPWFFVSKHLAVTGDIDMFNPNGSGSDLTWIEQDGDATKELCIAVYEYANNHLNIKVGFDRLGEVQVSTGALTTVNRASGNTTDFTTILSSGDSVRIERGTYTVTGTVTASSFSITSSYTGNLDVDVFAHKLGLNSGVLIKGGAIPETEVKNYLTVQGENDQGSNGIPVFYMNTWDSTDGYLDRFKVEVNSSGLARFYTRNTAGSAWVSALLIEPADTPLLNFQNSEISGNISFDSSARRIDFQGPQITSGSGSPEGSITADVGSTYMRSDGGAGTSFYVKESGSGNTGWVAK